MLKKVKKRKLKKILVPLLDPVKKFAHPHKLAQKSLPPPPKQTPPFLPPIEK